MTTQDPIVFKAREKEYRGWTSVDIQLSLQQLAGTFDLGMTWYNPGYGVMRQQFYRGDPCTLSLKSKYLITVFIDTKNINYDCKTHNVSVQGRDRTGDLVDCSYTGTTKQWNNAKIDRIISALCEPLGISVVVQVDVGKSIQQFAVDQGATVFSQVQQLCSYRGILPISYGDGKLYLVQAGKERATDNLELGINIEACDTTATHSDRFSHYIVKGQAAIRQQGVSDLLNPAQKPAYTNVGRARDSEIKRFRPLIILQDGEATNAECRKRAWWESWTRAGRSRDINVTVQGWTMSDGKPWPLNRLVHLKDPRLVLDEDLLIAGVNYKLSDSGTLTRLTLCHPYTYAPYSEKEPEPDVGQFDNLMGKL